MHCMLRPSTPIRERLDRTGILISGLCVVHCVVGLLAVTLLGLGGEFLLDPAWHRVGLGIAICVGVVTIGLAAVHHGRLGPLAIAGVGLALMSGGLFVSHGFAEASLTVPGVMLVAAAHLLNLRHAF